MMVWCDLKVCRNFSFPLFITFIFFEERGPCQALNKAPNFLIDVCILVTPRGYLLIEGKYFIPRVLSSHLIVEYFKSAQELFR